MLLACHHIDLSPDHAQQLPESGEPWDSFWVREWRDNVYQAPTPTIYTTGKFSLTMAPFTFSVQRFPVPIRQLCKVRNAIKSLATKHTHWTLPSEDCRSRRSRNDRATNLLVTRKLGMANWSIGTIYYWIKQREGNINTRPRKVLLEILCSLEPLKFEQSGGTLGLGEPERNYEQPSKSEVYRNHSTPTQNRLPNWTLLAAAFILVYLTQPAKPSHYSQAILGSRSTISMSAISQSLVLLRILAEAGK